VGFKYRYDADQDQFAHASGVVVLTPEGRISRYLFGVDYAPRDLRLALVEASRKKIGSIVDQLLLFCYHYDPATGKYGAAAMGALRIGGVLTLIALGMLITVMLRPDLGRGRADLRSGRRGALRTRDPALRESGPSAREVLKR
jgi:protein SCO1/2